MPEVFFRSKHVLDGDDSNSWGMGALVAVCVLFAWALWFFLARIAVYRVSDVARLESGGARIRCRPQLSAGSFPPT